MIGTFQLISTWLTMQAAIAAAPTLASVAPYPPSPVLAGANWNWSTHVRLAAGSDNFPMTWAADGHQYCAWGDGWGFDGGSTKKSLGFSRIEGTKDAWTPRDTYGSENAEAVATVGGKSYAILAVNGALYSLVSPGSESTNLESATLHKSTDGGHSWIPTAVTFTAATHDLALPGFLQFGRDDAGARDGYVYAYWTRVQQVLWQTQKPGEIILTRVPRDQIETMNRYEYFSGLDGSGNPTWSASPGSMRPVFTDPNGVLVNSAIHVAGLDRYLLVTYHTTWNQGNLAIFDAPEPWGPWTTVAYHSGWPLGGEVDRNTFYGNFASKWFSADGLDFVFVFTGTNANDSWNSVQGSFVLRTGDTTPPNHSSDLRPGP